MKKMNLTPLMLIMAITFTPASATFSQANASTDSIKKMLVEDWQRAKAYTQDYLKAMPTDKYSLKATDSVKSFAQQMLHIAQANAFFMSSATGEKGPYSGPDLEKSASAQTADSVMYYVNSSYDFAISAIQKASASSLAEMVTLNLGKPYSFTRLAWMLKAFEHQTHHRGQTTVYIRLAGVRPPNERLF